MADLKISIIVDDQGNVKLSGVTGRLGEMETKLNSLGSAVKMVAGGFASLYAIQTARRAYDTVRGWLDEADAIAKNAHAIGLTTKELQQYDYVAIRANVSTEKFASGMTYFAKKMGELQYGTGELVEKLKYLDRGFIPVLQRTTTTGQALDLFLKKIDSLKYATDRAALAGAAFGRGGSGVALVEFLRDGYTEMDKMRKSAESMGVVLDESLIKKSSEAAEELKVLHMILHNQLLTVALDLAPALAGVAKAIAGITLAVSSLSKEIINSGLIQTMLNLGTILTAAAAGGVIGGVPGMVVGAVIGGGLAGLKHPATVGEKPDEYEAYIKGLQETAEEEETRINRLVEFYNKSDMAILLHLPGQEVYEETLEYLKSEIKKINSETKFIDLDKQKKDMDTYVDYYKLNIDKNIIEYNRLYRVMNEKGMIEWVSPERKKEIEKLEKEWEKTVERMGKSFTDAMYDSTEEGFKAFDKFFDKLKENFIKMWLDKAITQPIIEPTINYLGGMFGAPGATPTGAFAKTMSGSAFGITGGASYGQMLGAGAVGYGMGGIGGGLGAAGGMMAGTALLGSVLGTFAGPLGAAMGGMAGNYIGKMFESDPPKPKINLLFEAIDGKIQEVSDSFRDSPRSQELINQVQATLQTQIDFYKNMSEILTGKPGSLINGQIFLTGNSGINITKATGNNAAIEAADLLQQGITKIFPDFEKEFIDAFNKGFGGITLENFIKSLSSSTYDVEYRSGTFAPEALNNIMSSKDPSQALTDWFNSTIYGVRPERTSSWGGTINKAVYWQPGGNPDNGIPFEDLLNKYMDILAPIQQSTSQAIGNAFLESLDTNEFGTFKQSLESSLFDTIKQSMAQGFIDNVLNQVLGSGVANALSVVGQYAAGELQPITETTNIADPFGKSNGVTSTRIVSPLDQVMNAVNGSLSGLDESLNALEPIFQPIQGWINKLGDALGVNTNAITSNTDAIMGPVNSFLMSLDTGPLAPSQSLAGIENIGKNLYTAALADPSQFAAYASFMTQTGLPTQQGLSQEGSGDYQNYVAGVRSGVTDIPWVAEARSAPSSKSIGYEVGQALAPMLKDIADSGAITINLVVDGHVVKSAVLDSLSDPTVVATIKDL